MVHTPMVLTGATRETQEKHTPAKAHLLREQAKPVPVPFTLEKGTGTWNDW